MVQPIVHFCSILNNQGVAQFLNRQYLDAADTFTRALQLAKYELSVLQFCNIVTARPMEDDLDGDTRGLGAVSVQGPTHNILHDTTEYLVPCNCGGGCDENNLPFVYRTPLIISESIATQDYESTVEAAVAIMFNLALAHHLQGEEQSFNEPSALRKALALYELAYALQVQEDIDVSVEITMAIINNLGSIHRELDDQEKASQCFQHLLSTMLFVQTLGECDFTLGTEGFVRNVSHLILKDVVASAA
jgi:tetratricopeptide (TPR) repeat protein